jgi:hypothetical protein
VPRHARVLVALTYLALIVLITFGMAHTHVARNFGDA